MSTIPATAVYFESAYKVKNNRRFLNRESAYKVNNIRLIRAECLVILLCASLGNCLPCKDALQSGGAKAGEQAPDEQRPVHPAACSTRAKRRKWTREHQTDRQGRGGIARDLNCAGGPGVGVQQRFAANAPVGPAPVCSRELPVKHLRVNVVPPLLETEVLSSTPHGNTPFSSLIRGICCQEAGESAMTIGLPPPPPPLSLVYTSMKPSASRAYYSYSTKLSTAQVKHENAYRIFHTDTRQSAPSFSPLGRDKSLPEEPAPHWRSVCIAWKPSRGEQGVAKTWLLPLQEYIGSDGFSGDRMLHPPLPSHALTPPPSSSGDQHTRMATVPECSPMTSSQIHAVSPCL